MIIQKLKILIIAPFPIYPPKEGGSIYVYNYAKSLKEKGHEINFIVAKDPNNEDNNKFKKEFNNIVYIRKKNILKSIFSFEPYRNERLKPSNTELVKIKNLIKNVKYDIIIFEGAFSSIFYKLLDPQIKNIKKIFIAHNIDYIDTLNRGKDSKNIFFKLFYFLDTLKLKRVETNFIKKFDFIFSVSPIDVNNLKKINPKATIKWFPPIIYISENTSNFNLDEKVENIIKNYKNKILFSGSLNSISNVTAIQWFSNKVMPLLRKNQLICCFIIVGRNPNRNILELQNKYKDIFVFPNVESLAPFYNIADLVVVPLFNNAGVKIKLIEALKYGKKIVSRSEGVYGSGLSNIIPTADTPEDFAQKCIDVLEGKIDFGPIWKKFNEIYDNQKIIDDFEKSLLI